jgi:succinyl-CoA synthetase beta subunit
MKIHEFQGKQLFRAAGIPVPEGIAVKTADEAADAFRRLGGKIAVVKAQIHAGGRGKGAIKTNPDQRSLEPGLPSNQAQLLLGAWPAKQSGSQVLRRKQYLVRTSSSAT